MSSRNEHILGLVRRLGRVCADGIYRTPEQEAAQRGQEVGSPEWHERMNAAGRTAFTNGHMGTGGADDEAQKPSDPYNMRGPHRGRNGE